MNHISYILRTKNRHYRRMARPSSRIAKDSRVGQRRAGDTEERRRRRRARGADNASAAAAGGIFVFEEVVVEETEAAQKVDGPMTIV
jgi:hypothetical protein